MEIDIEYVELSGWAQVPKERDYPSLDEKLLARIRQETDQQGYGSLLKELGYNVEDITIDTDDPEEGVIHFTMRFWHEAFDKSTQLRVDKDYWKKD